MTRPRQEIVDQPPPLVKGQLVNVLSEIWARQLILGRFGLGERKSETPPPRGSHYIVYDLADGPKRPQVRRPRGVRVDLRYSDIGEVIDDAIKHSAYTLVKEQLSTAGAKAGFERWQTRSRTELVEILRDAIRQDLEDLEQERELWPKRDVREPPGEPIDYMLVDQLIDETGTERVAVALWLHELLAREGPWWRGIASTFRINAIAGLEYPKRNFFMRIGRNFERVDLDLLEEIVDDPPWSVPKDLRHVIGRGHPDFVVIEAITLGNPRSLERSTSIWTAAHIFEIKANAGRLTRTQQATLERAQRFPRIHYSVLHFDFDVSVGPTTITESGGREA